MKLDIKLSASQGDYIKYLQWGVFIAVCATLGWAFYFYYDLDKQLDRVEQSEIIADTKINESKLQQVKNILSEREKEFRTPSATNRNPFE